MTKNEYKNHIKNIITKEMKESEQSTLPKVGNASFKRYNKTWATVIAVDIVGYKKMMEAYKRWAMINILQAFTSSVIKLGKENPYFVSAYINGDQVILCFSADKVHKINSIYYTALRINYIANQLQDETMRENGYIYHEGKFSVGIGIWTSDDNSLVKYGEKGSEDESFSTLIGQAINYATEISNYANRNWRKEILMNYTTYRNIEDDEKTKSEGWISRVENPSYNFNETLYGTSSQWEI